jgi:CDP-glucose 4,6-dehydratase
LNWSRVIPGTIRSALAGERPVIRSDGTPVRDYLFVDDAVSAYAALAQGLIGGRAQGEAFNFGTSEPIAVLPLVKKILAACDRGNLEPDIQGTAQAEIDRQYLDSHRAASTLGWRPSVGLDEGLRRTVDWYRKFAAQLE